MRDFENTLRIELRDAEYSEGYAESFLNSYIATQIKVIREQRGMTQAELGEHIGTTQAGVSRYENVNYSSWSIKTLIRLARAFHVRLKVSFEPFGSLPEEVMRFDRKGLERVKREEDSALTAVPSAAVATLDNREGNVVPINIYEILGATADRNKKPSAPTQSKRTEDQNAAYAEFSTGGAQSWR